MKKITWISIIAILIFIFLSVFLHNLNILSPIEGVITYCFKPIQIPLYKLSLNIFDSALLEEKQILIDENIFLKEKNQRLLTENSELKRTSEENKLAKEQSDFLNTQKYNYEQAKIINKSTTNNAQIITINIGKNKNLKRGQAVIDGQGILVGKVAEISDNTAEILLLSSNISKVASQIQNENNTPGIIVGQHGLGLDMELIPKGDIVEKNNTIITSGLEENIPKGLLIGEIDEVNEKEADLFNSATVIPAVDYSRLSIVSVIVD